jgi:hypothetical protein
MTLQEHLTATEADLTQAQQQAQQWAQKALMLVGKLEGLREALAIASAEPAE